VPVAYDEDGQSNLSLPIGIAAATVNRIADYAFKPIEMCDIGSFRRLRLGEWFPGHKAVPPAHSSARFELGISGRSCHGRVAQLLSFVSQTQPARLGHQL
jgi:hypothetical protein